MSDEKDFIEFRQYLLIMKEDAANTVRELERAGKGDKHAMADIYEAKGIISFVDSLSTVYNTYVKRTKKFPSMKLARSLAVRWSSIVKRELNKSGAFESKQPQILEFAYGKLSAISRIADYFYEDETANL